MKKCQFCAEEIQDEAIVCKHCGKELKKNTTPSAKKKSSLGSWKSWAFIVGSIFIIAIFINQGIEKNTDEIANGKYQNTGQNQQPKMVRETGAEAFLRLPDNPDPNQAIMLTKNKEDYSQVFKALDAQDYLGLLEIPGAFAVHNGSRAKVIETSVTMVKVRIMAGVLDVDNDKVGMAGWLPTEWVVDR